MRRLMAAVGVMACVACAGSRGEERTSSGTAGQHAAAAAPAGGMGAGEMAMACPMDVPGTTVSAADTPQGEALTFTTTSGQVDELRRRVHAMADMHNRHHAGAAGTGGAMEHGEHAMAEGHMMPPPSRASVEDVENGARVSVTPNDPAQADRLRTTARMHAEHMQREGCGMMGAPAK